MQYPVPRDRGVPCPTALLISLLMGCARRREGLRASFPDDRRRPLPLCDFDRCGFVEHAVHCPTAALTPSADASTAAGTPARGSAYDGFGHMRSGATM